MLGRIARSTTGKFALVALALGGIVAAAPGALAGSTYTVRTASIPSTSQQPGPEPGGGARITNKPYGYYLGRATVGSRFTSMGTVKNHRWGRAHNTVNMCGWVYLDAIEGHLGEADNSCSFDTLRTLVHRRTIGRDFNFPPHTGNNASLVTVLNPECPFFLNYFYGTDFRDNGGHWNHPAGPIGTYIEYRFTTNDQRAYVMRHPVYGWGFVPAGCTTRPDNLNNEDD